MIVLQALQNSSMPSSTNHHRESTTFSVLTTTPAYRSRSRVIAILTSTLLFAVKRHNNLVSNKLIRVKFSSLIIYEQRNSSGRQSQQKMTVNHYAHTITVKQRIFFFKVNLSQMNILFLTLFTINKPNRSFA